MIRESGNSITSPYVGDGEVGTSSAGSGPGGSALNKTELACAWWEGYANQIGDYLPDDKVMLIVIAVSNVVTVMGLDLAGSSDPLAPKG